MNGVRRWGPPRGSKVGVWYVVLCLLLFAFVGEAAAQGGGVDAIRAKMDQGQALFLSGKYEEAARVFEQGYSEHPYSAFLFNAGVCHQKVGQADKALANFRRYLEKDPSAPDAPQVSERIAKLEAALAAARPEPQVDPNAPPCAEEPCTQTPAQPTEAPVTVPDETNAKMKSLVVVETEPAGAPLFIYQRVDSSAAPFRAGSENPGWRLVAERAAPADFTLDVGRYHIVVEKFREFNRSETDIDVSPGHVHQFKANLSQGAFMAFLRVNSNVAGADVYLDDDGRKKVLWGRAPYGQLVSPGPHQVLVEAPGFEPAQAKIELTAGEQKELDVQLVRLGFGIVRIDSNAPVIEVSVDDKPQGKWKRGDVALEVRLPAGQHEIRVSADGHKDLRTVVDVPRGQVLPVRAHMIESYPRGTAWVQAILAAGFIGASTYFAIESDRLDSNLRADRAAGVLSAQDPRIDQGYWYSIGANAGFVVGGVFGGLSIYNFLKDPYPDSSLRKGKRQEFDSSRGPEPARPAMYKEGAAQ